MRAWGAVVVLLVVAPLPASSRPARTQPARTVAGDCPPGSAGDSVQPILDVMGQPPVWPDDECVARIMTADLRTFKNLSRELGCQEGSMCSVKSVLDHVAKEQGIPAELVYAVAWTETSWKQWTKDGKPLVSRSGDVGILQINKKAWGETYDMSQVAEDLLYNARAGATVLKWAYTHAKRRGYRGDDLLRATYAVFNGGPGAASRPWIASSPWAAHDRNFEKWLKRKPWKARVRGCS